MKKKLSKKMLAQIVGGTDNNQVQDKIIEIINDVTGRETIDQNDGNQKLQDDLHLDSLDLAEVHMQLEKTYQIVIPDENMEKFKTVDDLVKYINPAKKDS